MICRVTNFASNLLIWCLIFHAKPVGPGRKSRFSLYLRPVEPLAAGYRAPGVSDLGAPDITESVPREVPTRDRGSKRSGLALPLRAKERRSAGLRDSAHAAAAVAARTGLAFVAVYRPVMLEITERTIGLDVIAQR